MYCESMGNADHTTDMSCISNTGHRCNVHVVQEKTIYL